MIRLKRAYEPASSSDGTRYLVERLWPRGVKKTALHIDAWLKDVAPSTALRQWCSKVFSLFFAFEALSELDALFDAPRTTLLRPSVHPHEVRVLFSSRRIPQSVYRRRELGSTTHRARNLRQGTRLRGFASP